MDPSRKRQRANTNGDSAPGASTTSAHQLPLAPAIPAYDISQCIEKLHEADDGEYLRKLLLSLGNAQPSIAAIIRQAYAVHIANDIWHKINEEHEHPSGTRRFEASFSVFSEITSIIKDIGSQASTRNASFGTKRPGLETLREIGDTICEGGGEVGHQVRKEFQHDSSLVDAMRRIVEVMTEEERDQMYGVKDGTSTFVEKMAELLKLGKGYWVFEGLGEVIDRLWGKGFDEEEELEDEEEDEAEVEESQDGGPVNDAHEIRILDCFDRGGAPKRDKRSLEIMKCLGDDGRPKRDAVSQAILNKYCD